MSTNENTDVTAAEEAAAIDSIMGNVERDALISQAREFLEVDLTRLAKNEFQPTMFFREKGYPAPRAVLFPQLDGDVETRSKIGWATMLIAATIDDLHSITWVTDSFHATSPTKSDGTPWGYGEMQKAFNEGGEDAKLVGEMVNYQTMEVLSDGSRRNSMICFRYTRNGDTIDVDWDDPQVLIEGKDGHMQGFYVDAMNRAFDTPKLRAEIKKMFPGDLGLSDTAEKVHALCAAVKMVMQQVQMPVLIPVRNDEEQEILKRSFEEGPQFGDLKIELFDQDQVELISRLEEQFDLDSTMYRDALKTQKEA